jgi:hypothetical protein
MTTGEAIRGFCQECVSSHQKKVIENCGGEMVLATKKPCALFKYRLKGRGTLKAIRRNCVECQGGSYEGVEDCSTESCLLHPFRLGKLPGDSMGVHGRLILQNRFKPSGNRDDKGLRLSIGNRG